MIKLYFEKKALEKNIALEGPILTFIMFSTSIKSKNRATFQRLQTSLVIAYAIFVNIYLHYIIWLRSTT